MKNKTPAPAPSSPPTRHWPSAVIAIALFATLTWAVLSLPAETGGLAGRALDALEQSGVSNPVTAALLNYRAYDTLLEIGVLLLAVVATWAMARADPPGVRLVRGPVLHGLARVLTPLLIVSSGYFLWIGSSQPGGAFQAGALLGGAGVLLVLAHGPTHAWPAAPTVRIGLTLGLLVFLAVAAAMIASGRRLLEYPLAWAGALILVIEAAATVSIGLTLVALFRGGRPDDPGKESRPGESP